MSNKRDLVVGDKVVYEGSNYEHLLGKNLEVKYVRDYSGIKVIAVEDDNRYYDPTFFRLADDLLDFSAVLLDHCNSAVLDNGGAVFIDILNERSKKELKKNYTKQDILHVLRVLEKYNVKATLAFNSSLDDNLSITIYAEDILEELGSNTPETFPTNAIIDLCCRYSVCASIKDFNTYYILGHDGVVYDTREYKTTEAV